MKIKASFVTNKGRIDSMNCKGCAHQMKNKLECCFTISGVVSLNNCLCETCLIKPICSEMCSEVKRILRQDKNSHFSLHANI